MALVGGLGERYCTQRCYEAGGSTVTKHLLSNWTGDCSVCRGPVTLRLGGAASMVCWKPGAFLFHCGSASCVAAVKQAVSQVNVCPVCGSTVSNENSAVTHATLVDSTPSQPVQDDGRSSKSTAGAPAATPAAPTTSASTDPVIRYLTERKADPFVIAAEGNEEEAVATLTALLEKDSGWITRTNENGATLLFRAVAEKRLRVISLLLAKGADVLAATRNGNTPLKVAHDRRDWDGYAEVIALLDQHDRGRQATPSTQGAGCSVILLAMAIAAMTAACVLRYEAIVIICRSGLHYVPPSDALERMSVAPGALHSPLNVVFDGRSRGTAHGHC